MVSKNNKYFLGLDCGTNSVGWAATDEEYRLLRNRGKYLHGVRLFDAADTAAERRIFRSGRRRHERAKTRLKLLRRLFRDEMLNVDPEFYQRLHESFFYEEDKNLQHNSKNTLFNDPNYDDKKFHSQYPTIWHLRQAIIHAGPNEHFDLRLYYLAIQHILKHRGHFLIDGTFTQSSSDFEKLYDAFVDAAQNYGYNLENSNAEKIKAIVCDKKMTKLDKKKQIKELWQDAMVDLEAESDEDFTGDLTSLAGLLIGSSVDLKKVFDLEESQKCDFGGSNFEEKQGEIAEAIGAEKMDLILAAKQIYDFGLLHNLLGSHQYISDAMVANYEQHEKDLKELKRIFKPHQEIYQKLFKSKDASKEPNSYAAYIGQARALKGGRPQTAKISQADFNKHIKKLLEEIGYSGNLLGRAERGELLPKQRGQAKGTIPQQIHHQELEKILAKLEQDFPSFAKEDPNEKSSTKTKSQKIAAIHSFRIPYYCGPLVKRKYDADGKPVKGGRSEFSWADQEINQLVYPWNFDDLVDKDARANNFIRRMTNECSKLIGEPVLPKSSLSYEKYMVLNELNNLKLGEHRIDNDLKQAIFQDGFIDGTLTGNITLRKLSKWLHDNYPDTRGLELGGTSTTKFLPKLTTYHDFKKILGSDFERRYSRDQLNDAVEAITILGDEKSMLRRKLAEILKLDANSDEVKNLAKLSYKDWGKFSNKFLNGITHKIDGRNMTILDALWETSANLNELLGSEYGFQIAVDEFNSYKTPEHHKITYQDVEALYCSPAVKRSIWQTLKIVDEIVRITGHAPAKIFLEVTREDYDAKRKQYTTSRKTKLEQQLKAVNSPDAQAILKELEGREERELQSRKLFLYFSQMGKCAYCGKPIDLEELNNWQLYDIDHIYPRSLTKDDSITKNLVLVHASENRDKTNVYPVTEDIRKKMTGIWAAWRRAGLITQEKFDRLTRSTPLTADELGGFIARQIVETSQSVRAIRDLLQSAYPGTKVIMVKAGQVSDLRHYLGYDRKNHDGVVVEPGRPEFIKIRDLNDFHHAKDAYLNIVVGNVMNSTFTSDPANWVKQRDNQHYTISTQRIFRSERKYKKKDGSMTTWPDVSGWNFSDSIKIMSDVMKNNDILWTRMSYIESGPISDLQIVSKSEKTEGILPIKQGKRFDPKKYGGYNSIKGAHFALIETSDKNNELKRNIIAIPQFTTKNLDAKNPKYSKLVSEYISSNYPNSKLIIPVIKFKAKIEINNIPLYIVGRSGSSRLLLQHGVQLVIPEEFNLTVKNVCNIVKKDRISKGKYEIDKEKDGIDDEKIDKLFTEINKKLSIYKFVPGLETLIEKINLEAGTFYQLDPKSKCKAITELLKVLSCNAEKGDLSSFVPKASVAGSVYMNSKLNEADSVQLIEQSPTGFFERVIDLQTVKPRNGQRKGKNSQK